MAEAPTTPPRVTPSTTRSAAAGPRWSRRKKRGGRASPWIWTRSTSTSPARAGKRSPASARGPCPADGGRPEDPMRDRADAPPRPPRRTSRGGKGGAEPRSVIRQRESNNSRKSFIKRKLLSVQSPWFPRRFPHCKRESTGPSKPSGDRIASQLSHGLPPFSASKTRAGPRRRRCPRTNRTRQPQPGRVFVWHRRAIEDGLDFGFESTYGTGRGPNQVERVGGAVPRPPFEEVFTFSLPSPRHTVSRHRPADNGGRPTRHQLRPSPPKS